MNKGDKVLVRRFDGVDHWIYAIVLDPANNSVQVAHPGNREDGRVLMVSPADLRTKADIQSIATQAQAIVAQVGPRGMTEAQIRQLGALDGFWLSFVTPADGRLTEFQSKHLAAQQTTLHQLIAKHYNVLISQLS